MSTFAIPFEQREGARPRTAGFFNAKFEKSSLKRLKGKYKQVPKKENESVNSFGIKASGIKLRKIKKYTKKSLILAQDER